MLSSWSSTSYAHIHSWVLINFVPLWQGRPQGAREPHAPSPWNLKKKTYVISCCPTKFPKSVAIYTLYLSLKCRKY